MKLNRINSTINREERNKLNENFDSIEQSYNNVLTTSDESKINSDNALAIANKAELKADDVQAQFNQVVIEGDSSVEAAQARVSTNGLGNQTSFVNLKQRLDTEHNEVIAQLAQTNSQLDNVEQAKASKIDLTNAVEPKADITYVNSNISTLDTKLNAMASGTPKIVVQSVVDLPTIGGVEKIALVLDDGHKYYDNGTAWVDAGLYQSTGLDKNETYQTLGIENPIPDITLTNTLEKNNFESPTEWGASNATVEIINNEATFIASASGGRISTGLSITSGHKYFLKAHIQANSSKVYLTVPGYQTFSHNGSGQYEIVSGIVQATSTSETSSLRVTDSRTSGWSSVKVKKVVLFDLTEIFGFGNEPTNEEVLLLLSEFTDHWFTGTVTLTNTLGTKNKVLANVNGILRMAELGEIATANGLPIGEKIEGLIATDTRGAIEEIIDNTKVTRLFNVSEAQLKTFTNLVSNGNFVTPWGSTAPNHTVANNAGYFTATVEGQRINVNIATVSKNKYYVKALIKADSPLVGINFAGTTPIPHRGNGQLETVSGIINGTITGSTSLRIQDNRQSGWTEVQVKEVMVIDLTGLYGTGNEPTKEEFEYILSFLNNGMWFGSSIQQEAPFENEEVIVYNGLRFTNKKLSDFLPLANKKIVCFGDSVTERGNYPEIAGAKTGAITYNVGFGGCRMSYHSIPEYDAFSMYRLADSIASGDWSLQDTAAQGLITKYADDNTPALNRLKALNFNEIDIISIMYATNDWGQSIDLGTSESIDTRTFYGAMNYVIDKIQTAYPHLQIMFITPTWRWNDGIDCEIAPNLKGTYLHEFVDAMIDRTNKYKLPILNLYNSSGLNKYTAKLYLVDDVHLSQNGFGLIGNKVGAFWISHF